MIILKLQEVIKLFRLKLKELRENKGISQKELSEKLNVAQSTVGMWESGKREPNFETAVLIAKYFSVSTDELLGYRNFELPIMQQNVIKIPVLGRIPAGVPIEAIEDIIDYVEISSKLVTGDKKFFALKLKGNSMSPKYIDGDIVIFEKNEDCESGSDCAIAINGDDVTFKRIDKNESGIVVRPLNPDYNTMYFTNDDIINKPIRILGIAKEIRRNV